MWLAIHCLWNQTHHVFFIMCFLSGWWSFSCIFLASCLSSPPLFYPEVSSEPPPWGVLSATLRCPQSLPEVFSEPSELSSEPSLGLYFAFILLPSLRCLFSWASISQIIPFGIFTIFSPLVYIETHLSLPWFFFHQMCSTALLIVYSFFKRLFLLALHPSRAILSLEQNFPHP